MRKRWSRPRSAGLTVLLGCLSLGFLGQDECDVDGDGYTEPAGDCDDNDPLTYPGADERADIKDNNCNGFADEPPRGLTLAGDATALQGWATAVAHRDDFLFVTGAATLEVFHRAADGELEEIGRLEFDDVVIDMTRDGDYLFVAANNAGLVAVDISDPYHPIIVGEVADISASDVDARHGRVAVTLKSSKTVSVYPFGAGGFGPALFTYSGEDCLEYPDCEHVSSVALAGDSAQGLYVGYSGNCKEDGLLGESFQEGDLAWFDDYATSPAAPSACLPRAEGQPIGAVTDIVTAAGPEQGQAGVFVSIERKYHHDTPSLRWAAPSCDGTSNCVLEETVPCASCYCEEPDPMDCAPGTLLRGRGNAVAGDSGLVCVGGMHVTNYALDNLSCITDPLGPTARAMTTRTMDLVYDLDFARQDEEASSLYVADEWGGLQVYQVEPGSELSLESREPTGAQSFRVWRDGPWVYSVKEGAGLWGFHENGAPGDPYVLEDIPAGNETSPDGSRECYYTPGNNGDYDPEGPSCPETIFAHDGASRGDILYLLAGNRFDIVGLDYSYFLVLNRATGEVLFRDYLSRHFSYWGLGNVVVREDPAGTNLVFVASGSNACNPDDLEHYGPCEDGTFDEAGLRLYEHNQATNEVRLAAFVPTSTLPEGAYARLALDAALYGDFVFVPSLLFVNNLKLFESEGIRVFRWRDASGNLELEEISTIAPVDDAHQPLRVLVDEDHGLLISGGTRLLAYPLERDSNGYPVVGEPVELSPGEDSRATALNIWGMERIGDRLYVADPFNGVYGYDIANPAVMEPAVFYPTFDSLGNEPIPLPDEVRPLHEPRDLEAASDGSLLVQEWITGRVRVLHE